MRTATAIVHTRDTFLRVHREKTMPFTAATRKEMKYVPVMEATWMKGRNVYCEWPRKAQGKPVMTAPLAYSSTTHTGAARRYTGTEVLFSRYAHETVKIAIQGKVEGEEKGTKARSRGY